MRVRVRQVFSCLLSSILLLPLLTTGVGAKDSQAKNEASKEAAKDTSTARLTETRGEVYRRGFVDWNRETWGDPVPAKVGDKLVEGMQIGVGGALGGLGGALGGLGH